MPKIKLTNVRLSFPDLFEAVQFQGKGPFNYGCQLLVPANSPQKKLIDETLHAVAKEKWAGKAKAILEEVLPDKKACCWINGDRREYDGYAGNWALTAKRKLEKGAPLVLDTNKSPLTAKSGKPYAGCFVDAVVEIYAQDSSDGKGLRCSLSGVQFRKDGDAFGAGQPPSAEDFENLSEGANASFEDEDSLV